VLGPLGITVNAICPGVVMTEMGKEIDRTMAGILGVQPGEPTQQRIPGIPLGRIAEEPDIADVAAFLASDDARYVNGQAINVDGGMRMD